jgi:hypothetical protein
MNRGYMDIEVRVDSLRILLMLVYLIGVITFLCMSEWVTAIMLCAVMYWTNISWFYEGKCRALHNLLTDAKEIIEGKIKDAEPVSTNSGERHE